MQMYCAGKWDVDQMIRTLTVLKQTQTRDFDRLDIESDCIWLCEGGKYDNCQQPCDDDCDKCFRDEDCSCYCTGCNDKHDHCDLEGCNNCDCEKDCYCDKDCICQCNKEKECCFWCEEEVFNLKLSCLDDHTVVPEGFNTTDTVDNSRY